jgi:REP element-mobilizing transposase RayT
MAIRRVGAKYRAEIMALEIMPDDVHLFIGFVK